MHKPAYRICVNTSTTHGSIGLTTGLDPAMTLGCGGFGGNITSDNITPRHLLNVKRLAYELRPAPRSAGTSPPICASAVTPSGPSRRCRARPAPAGARRSRPSRLAEGIDRWLAGRPHRQRRSAPAPPPPAAVAEAFICEDDVRRAVQDGRRLMVGPRTIVTPAARDAGLRRTCSSGSTDRRANWRTQR